MTAMRDIGDIKRAGPSGESAMMTKEVTPILKSLGWKVFTDDVGDKYSHYDLPDRVVQIIYGVRRGSDHQELGTTLSVSTEAFSTACASILGRRSSYSPLVRAWTGIHIRASEILHEHVCQASDDAIVWARDQNLDKALRAHAELPTNAPGARPVWHLAALALLGDVEKLKFYQASFEAEDQPGFVSYVTKDYIDRAVLLASNIVSGA